MDMPNILSLYVRVILEFILEMTVFCALTSCRLQRARYFALRVVCGMAGMAAAGFGISFFYAAFGTTVWGRIAVYIVLFLLFTGYMRLCFDEPYKIVLFCCSYAYAAQNLVYKLFLFFWSIGEEFRLYDGWGNYFELFYRLFYYLFFAAAAAAAYFLFIRPLTRRLSERQLNFRTFIISVIVLGITVILCSIDDIFFAKLSDYRENRYENFDYFVLSQTGHAFSVVCCALVMMLISRTVERRELQEELSYLQYEMRQREQQYEISKDTIDLINVKCHDIKYKLGSLLAGQGQGSENAVSDLYESISIYDTKVSTGNDLLDVLLTEKSLYCEQHGITFSCLAQGEKLAFMDRGDLFCLFGNIIDNALEAVRGLPEREKRVINLSVKSKNDLLIVQEENYFGGQLSFKDGLPVTIKEDKNYHGFGTRSIRMIARKYGGELTTGVSGDVFHLNIIFSMSEAR